MNAEKCKSQCAELRWYTSSYSSEEGGECVEVALTPAFVLVRDSKSGVESPRLRVTAEAWDAFLKDL
ncbi:DUF397 domain-containing protein [Streptomyces sp. N2-109]|uniref:DUF397 domain-containing protein n=1 Tax=Streptomyces gossypii TaxID=2883101 RepID=A0ABT2JTQ2_9ACTN|nr:DUF397 domain-containing protein [Streptomyces gossypii]MCT2590740.1 DUF397 domain-containing protein [Streptomyces gossypii]